MILSMDFMEMLHEVNIEYYRAWFDFLRALLSGALSAEALEEKYRALHDMTDAPGRLWFAELSERLGLSEFERFAVLLALGARADGEIARLCSEKTISRTGGAPDLFLASEAFKAVSSVSLSDLRLSGSFNRLMDKAVSGMSDPLRLSNAAVGILNGYTPDIAGCSCKLYENMPPLSHGEELQRKLAMLLRNATAESPIVLRMSGDRGSGRTYQLQKLSEQSGIPLLLIDAGQLRRETPDLKAVLDAFYLMMVTAPSIVCLREYSPDSEWFVRELQEFAAFLCVTTDTDTPLPDFSQEPLVITFEIPSLSRMERKKIWDHMLADHGVELPFDIRPIANQYKLSTGIIQKAVHAFKRRLDVGLEQNEDVLREIIEASVRQNIQNGLAKLIRPKFSWDDIILPAELKERLREICLRVTSSDLVMEKWGFATKYPYGNGISVLFYGAPGTGKTMAAHVIANELQTPLYYVDFSNMIDKYIGETEKHIFELFSQAKKSGAILFFDEADALFAKRSEVADATDRYANAQTACLLQCIEDYDGVVILATNLLSNFDEAFKRRIRYFLHFHHPDEQTRRLIWQSAFPCDAPLSADVDLTVLARMELSAGSIKNIVLTAAFLAADDGVISLNHLNRALGIEMIKDGRSGESEGFDG